MYTCARPPGPFTPYGMAPHAQEHVHYHRCLYQSHYEAPTPTPAAATPNTTTTTTKTTTNYIKLLQQQRR